MLVASEVKTKTFLINSLVLIKSAEKNSPLYESGADYKQKKVQFFCHLNFGHFLDSSDVFEFDSNTASAHNLAANSAESLESNSVEGVSIGQTIPVTPTCISRQSSADRNTSAATNQDNIPVYDDDLDSYDQVYEGLFIGVLSFVLTVNSKGERSF